MGKLTIKFHALMLPIVSFFVNCWWWLWHLNRLSKARTDKRLIRVECIQDIINHMKLFTWRSEKIEWRPWIITIIANDLSDDCDGAAEYGKWLIKKLGHKADVYNLWKTGSHFGHAVCYSRDLDLLISNDSVNKLNMENWREGLLWAFDYDYDMIDLNGTVIYKKKTG